MCSLMHSVVLQVPRAIPDVFQTSKSGNKADRENPVKTEKPSINKREPSKDREPTKDREPSKD